MSLKEQLQHDLKDAMRARDEHRKLALRMVLTAVQLAEVEHGEQPLTDDVVVDIIRKEVQRREDALKLIQTMGREDLIAEENVELDILRAYLPQLLGATEIAALAREAIAEVKATSPTDLGAVMRVLMPRVKGQADGRLVNQTVRDLLSAG
ncbi:MAG TPA: GatB/YqeY domain-containing protein [Anaerolineae bacterium]|nr:GatB/YqeY domain-containing protein [Anaerolineae bacterium]